MTIIFSDEVEFELMPSRFPYYDTETKMTVDGQNIKW